MKFCFHENAASEFENSVAFYEECRPGLGIEFAQEVYAAIGRIVQFPESWARMSNSTRRCLVNRFPFGIVYRINRDLVEVIAVADLRRRPGYWQGRS